MAFLVTILFNLFILGLWHRYRKKRGKKLAWYWGWILLSEVISLTLPALVGIAATTIFAFNSRIVFNIKGNSYRLVAKINFEKQWIFIRFVGTHEEYNKIDANIIYS